MAGRPFLTPWRGRRRAIQGETKQRKNTMKTTDVYAFRSIVFLQGEEATEALEILDNDGAESLLHHLAEYDYGEGSTTGHFPWGTSDTVHRYGDHFVTYNLSLGYVGLEVRVTREEAEQWGELDRLEKERMDRPDLAPA